MKRSKGCFVVLGVVAAIVFTILFIGSLIFTQSRASGQNTVTLPASPSVASATPGNPVQKTVDCGSGGCSEGAEVTVEIPPSSTPTAPAGNNAGQASATDTPGPIITATPGLAGLGTMTFPLTVTAQQAIDLTRVAGVHNSIGATEMAIEQESKIIFMTLTASAPTPRK